MLSFSSSLVRLVISVRDPTDFIAQSTSAAVGRRFASILIVVMIMISASKCKSYVMIYTDTCS